MTEFNKLVGEYSKNQVQAFEIVVTPYANTTAGNLQGRAISTTTLPQNLQIRKASAEAIAAGTAFLRSNNSDTFIAGPKVSKAALAALANSNLEILSEDGQVEFIPQGKVKVYQATEEEYKVFIDIYTRSMQELNQQRTVHEERTDTASLAGRVTFEPLRHITVEKRHKAHEKDEPRKSAITLSKLQAVADYQLNEKGIVLQRNVDYREKAASARHDDIRMDEVSKSEERLAIRKAGQTEPNPTVPKRRRAPRAA